MADPIKGAYGMWRERNNIRANSEKQEAVAYIIPQNVGQTGQVVLHGTSQPFLGVGGKSEGRVGGTANSTIDTRVSELHHIP